QELALDVGARRGPGAGVGAGVEERVVLDDGAADARDEVRHEGVVRLADLERAVDEDTAADAAHGDQVTRARGARAPATIGPMRSECEEHAGAPQAVVAACNACMVAGLEAAQRADSEEVASGAVDW